MIYDIHILLVFDTLYMCQAEGVQSFFNVNDYSATPNGIHGPISTRDKLRTYDPALYQLIEEVWPCHNTYLKRCVTSRGN